MNEHKRTQLIQAGIDVDSVMERFMGNEQLLDRMLQKFTQDTQYQALKEAIADNNMEQAFSASHTLKGMCGNLSMTELFALFSKQVELFRADKQAEACAMMTEIENAYQSVLEGIAQLS